MSAIASVLLGSFESAYYCLATPIVVDLLGLDSLTYGFGILMLTRGIAYLMGPPLGGLLIDKTGMILFLSSFLNLTQNTKTIFLGDYKFTFFCAAGLLLSASILSLLSWFVENIETKKEENLNK